MESSSERRGEWFQTFTGRAVYLIDPRPEEICIEDIAHGLAFQCRFNGHVSVFYSIASHSICVSQLVEPQYALQGLLHDATEAYLGDMVKPLKASMPEYREAEKRMWTVIAEKFGVPVDIHPSVKYADLVALATERFHLMGPSPLPWDIDEFGIARSSLPLQLDQPYQAETNFLRRFRKLTMAIEA